MKNDGKMSFRDFIFPINPAVIRIQHRKKLAVQSVPFGNDNISDSGEAGRVITGEGEFAGAGCINDFLALKQTAMKGPALYPFSGADICLCGKYRAESLRYGGRRRLQLPVYRAKGASRKKPQICRGKRD